MRQKPNFLIAVTILTALFASVVWAENPSAAWKGAGTVQVEGSRRYKAVFLVPEVYRAARPDLADLRLLDSKGRTVPYILQSGEKKSGKSEFVHPSVLIHTFEKKTASNFDFKIMQLHEENDTAGNVLELSMPDKEFLKDAELYGSYDGDAWVYLGATRIYRVNGLVNNRIPLNSRMKYGFYRVKLLNNAERIRIPGLNLIDQHLTDEWRMFERSATLPYRITRKNSHTLIRIGNPNRLKIKRIDLKIDGFFKRYVEVGCDHGMAVPISDPWIYQFSFKDQKASRTGIQLVEPCNARSINLSIANQNDRPLQIKSVRVVYSVDKLIFEGGDQPYYRLVFGNPKAVKPTYDMELFRGSVLAEDYDRLEIRDIRLKAVRTGEAMISVKQKALIFNIVLGLVAATIVFVLIRRLSAKT